MKEWKEIKLEDGNVGWVPTNVLQWDDLNMIIEELRINKQVNIVGSELVVNELKTKAGGPNHDLAASSQKSNGGV